MAGSISSEFGSMKALPYGQRGLFMRSRITAGRRTVTWLQWVFVRVVLDLPPEPCSLARRRRKGYASRAGRFRFSCQPGNCSNVKDIYSPVPSIQPWPNIRSTVQTVSDRIQTVSDLIRMREKRWLSKDSLRRIMKGKDPVGGEKLS